MTTTTFKYADLEPAAKERALEWYRTSEHELWEPEFDDYTDTLALLGFEVATETVNLMSGKTRVQSSFGYSIGYVQDDYANFSGTWRAADVNMGKLLEDRPAATTLHTYGAQLMALYLRWPDAHVRFSSPAPHRLHIDYRSVGADDPDTAAEVVECEELGVGMGKIIGSLFNWLYHELRDELEYQTSDEACIEGIEANDYSFDEDGSVV